MASEKLMYWLTLGVLALVMGNHLTSRIETNCFSDKARAVAERLSAQGEHLMASAEIMLGRSTTRFDRAQTALIVRQVRLESFETSLTRQQIACARAEAARAQVMVHQQFEQMPVVRLRPRAEAVVLMRSAGNPQNPI